MMTFFSDPSTILMTLEDKPRAVHFPPSRTKGRFRSVVDKNIFLDPLPANSLLKLCLLLNILKSSSFCELSKLTGPMYPVNYQELISEKRHQRCL